MLKRYVLWGNGSEWVCEWGEWVKNAAGRSFAILKESVDKSGGANEGSAGRTYYAK